MEICLILAIIDLSHLALFSSKCLNPFKKPNLDIFCRPVICNLVLNQVFLPLYCLKTTVDYFTEKNSRVYLSFLDCSKAFDRIFHWGLFIKLVNIKVPLCFLLCVMFQYLNMSCTVKWNNVSSRAFDIPTGTKQGGILSPDFFALYMHDLIQILRSSGFGCNMIEICIACIFFADDVVLLSPSRFGLQKLLNICVMYCRKFCLDFNVKKSKVMVIGRKSDEQYSPLLLNGERLEFVNTYRYL